MKEKSGAIFLCTDNAMIGVPTMLIAMLEHPTFPTRDLSSVKAICSGGSTVPAPLVKRFEEKLGAAFTIVFGQTECSPVAAQTRINDSVEDKANTIGLPLPNMETKIIGPYRRSFLRAPASRLRSASSQSR